MSTELRPCPKCKTAEHVKVDPDFIGFTVHCDNCYDVDCQGDPPQFVSLGYIAHGNTEAAAIESWNEYADDAVCIRDNTKMCPNDDTCCAEIHTCCNECGWCNGNPSVKV